MTPAEHYEAAERVFDNTEDDSTGPLLEVIAHALLALYQPPPEPIVMVQQPPPEKAKASTERKLIGPSWSDAGDGFAGKCAGCNWKVSVQESTYAVIELFDMHWHGPDLTGRQIDMENDESEDDRG